MNASPRSITRAEESTGTAGGSSTTPMPARAACTMPTERELFTPVATPWLPSAPAIDLAVDAIPVVADDTAATVIVELAMTIVDQREELVAVRTTLSVALTTLHKEQAKARRCIEERGQVEERERRRARLTTQLRPAHETRI